MSNFRKYQKWYGRWTLISTGNENIELIAVQGKIGNHDIRIFKARWIKGKIGTA